MSHTTIRVVGVCHKALYNMACAVAEAICMVQRYKGRMCHLFMELGQRSEVSEEVKMRAELRTRA